MVISSLISFLIHIAVYFKPLPCGALVRGVNCFFLMACKITGLEKNIGIGKNDNRTVSFYFPTV